MVAPNVATEFVVSLFGTPQTTHQEIFYSVLRAGHLRAGPEHLIEREHFPGQELIYCLRGQGRVRIRGKLHRVQPGQCVWVNCHQPHAYGAEPADPWELYWIRTDGLRLPRMGEVLEVASEPVFEEVPGDRVSACYREIFGELGEESPGMPARVHAAVARLLALFFESRHRATVLGGAGGMGACAEGPLPSGLRTALRHMKLAFFQPQRVEALAALAGMSSSHFSRLFKTALGTSPIDWLRRERINQAKRRLVETRDAVHEIAQQVGYSDRYFFSKDFKQIVGVSPREFRRREGPEHSGGERLSGG
jgi:AraC-like DNA-binding protein